MKVLAFVDMVALSYNNLREAIKLQIMETSLNAYFFDHFGLL